MTTSSSNLDIEDNVVSVENVEKKSRLTSHSSGVGSGRGRGRPRKAAIVHDVPTVNSCLRETGMSST